jgi:tripartite motif-containing protein 71
MNVYVADAGNGLVQVFDPQGTFLRAFGRGEGGWLKKVGKLIAPAGVAVDATGACYVTDVKLGVFKFDHDGHFLASFGHKGKREGELNWPRHSLRPGGLPSGSWIHNHRVQRFDPEGPPRLRRTGMTKGPRSSSPSDLAIDRRDAVRDRHAAQPCRLTARALPRGRLPAPGWASSRRAASPSTGGRIFVVERMNHRVQVFDRDGRYLCTFGGEGKRSGQFKEPYGIAINGRSEAYVSDNGNNRVQRFAVA